ncbi:MAG: hypothetical protein K6G88_10445 [Lachnospiraceae bacterium]|nr:hypothetical protein [Lachnospiraceae bacterium]
MKEIIFLGTGNYLENDSHNYGDCIILNMGNKLYIYDCGSIEHANTVIKYMEDNCFEKCSIILSHNDSDHFNGIPHLLDENKVDQIFTTLLFKYTDKILDKIDDKRRSKDSVREAIAKKYDNIAKLTGAPTVDIYENDLQLETEISIMGPDLEYMLDAVAKNLDGREGDTTDGETNVNATSIQVKVNAFGHDILLCGDSSYNAIEDKLDDFDSIQLPHHGKVYQAEKIFDYKENDINTYYFISDNTGNSNGGSDKLDTTGYKVYNTKKNGDIVINSQFYLSNNNVPKGRLG